MSMGRLALVPVLALMLFAGCKTVTGITYHHFDPNDGSYWMTTINTRDFGRQTAQFWRCTNDADGPACVQAKFVNCPAGANCGLAASSIASQVNLDHGYTGFKASRTPNRCTSTGCPVPCRTSRVPASWGNKLWT